VVDRNQNKDDTALYADHNMMNLDTLGVSVRQALHTHTHTHTHTFCNHNTYLLEVCMDLNFKAQPGLVR